jgi:hypothetical protein
VSQDRRNEPRMSLVVPVQVKGFDPSGAAWDEMTMLGDTSFGGASLGLQHAVTPGQVLHLGLPLPKRFRQYDLTETSYHVWALVRNVSPGTARPRVGVYFLGKKPPHGFEQNPAGKYLLPSDPPPLAPDRRKFARLSIFLNLKLVRPDERGVGPREELTIAENLGRWGARVLTSLPLAKGEHVDIMEVGGDFRTTAEIRNVYIGQDRIPRLNLKFAQEAPDRLVATS